MTRYARIMAAVAAMAVVLFGAFVASPASAGSYWSGNPANGSYWAGTEVGTETTTAPTGSESPSSSASTAPSESSSASASESPSGVPSPNPTGPADSLPVTGDSVIWMGGLGLVMTLVGLLILGTVRARRQRVRFVVPRDRS